MAVNGKKARRKERGALYIAAAQHQRPSFCVGLAHWRRVGFQRRLTGGLEHAGYAGQNMPVERSELSDDRRAAHEISDAPARHRPRL